MKWYDTALFEMVSVSVPVPLNSNQPQWHVPVAEAQVLLLLSAVVAMELSVLSLAVDVFHSRDWWSVGVRLLMGGGPHTSVGVPCWLERRDCDAKLLPPVLREFMRTYGDIGLPSMTLGLRVPVFFMLWKREVKISTILELTHRCLATLVRVLAWISKVPDQNSNFKISAGPD